MRHIGRTGGGQVWRAGLFALLAGCAAPATLPQVAIPLRNPTAPVASQADAGVARLEGGWVVVEGAGIAPGTRMQFAADGLRLGEVLLPVADTGRGRLDVGGAALWVHWIDVDNRTAALGDPGGGRVWIMDRTGQPGERLGAAREILAWYGYDLDRMERR